MDILQVTAIGASFWTALGLLAWLATSFQMLETVLIVVLSALAFLGLSFVVGVMIEDLLL